MPDRRKIKIKCRRKHRFVYKYFGYCKECWKEAGFCIKCFGGFGDGKHPEEDHKGNFHFSY